MIQISWLDWLLENAICDRVWASVDPPSLGVHGDGVDDYKGGDLLYCGAIL